VKVIDVDSEGFSDVGVNDIDDGVREGLSDCGDTEIDADREGLSDCGDTEIDADREGLSDCGVKYTDDADREGLSDVGVNIIDDDRESARGPGCIGSTGAVGTLGRPGLGENILISVFGLGENGAGGPSGLDTSSKLGGAIDMGDGL
jgi:hypothetical protein